MGNNLMSRSAYGQAGVVRSTITTPPQVHRPTTSPKAFSRGRFTLRNRHTGEVFELMHWDWSQGLDRQVAQLMNGQRIDEMTLAEHYEVVACEHCGEEHPAARWPEAVHAA